MLIVVITCSRCLGGKPLADAPSTHSAPAGTSNFPGSSKLPCWWSAEQAMKQQPGRDRKRQRQSTSDSKPAHEALDGFEAISTALQQYNPLLRSAPCSAPSSNQDDQTAWRFSRMAPGPFPFVPNPGEGTSSGPACVLGSSLCSAYGSMQNSSANVNESFVGSNVLNGSNNSSHSSQGGGSDGGKASGHNGQSAWNHMDPSRWTTAMQGAPDLSQSLLVTSWMPSTAASPTGPFLMHGHQQWGSNPMGAMKGAADSTGCDGSGRQRPGESCALANNDCSFPPVASMASSGMTPESIGMLLSQLGANPYVQNQMQQNCLAQLLLMQSQNMQMGMRPKAVGQPPAPGAAPLPDEGNSQLLNLLMQSGWSHSESMSGVRQSPQQMSQK
ncbi:unnamed protein product [Ostreobium quekettii]|uniref:Uncharacterized protein n=1 Tax=Ostreobium quekettii TaxID=121088 RepID=A0A8S1JG52_9CHLO|nr:unnamed protein product [Ostreobium quekettii]